MRGGARFSDLPCELVTLIAERLDQADKVALSACCQTSRKCTREAGLWKDLTVHSAGARTTSFVKNVATMCTRLRLCMNDAYDAIWQVEQLGTVLEDVAELSFCFDSVASLPSFGLTESVQFLRRLKKLDIRIGTSSVTNEIVIPSQPRWESLETFSLVDDSQNTVVIFGFPEQERMHLHMPRLKHVVIKAKASDFMGHLPTFDLDSLCYDCNDDDDFEDSFAEVDYSSLSIKRLEIALYHDVDDMVLFEKLAEARAVDTLVLHVKMEASWSVEFDESIPGLDTLKIVSYSLSDDPRSHVILSYDAVTDVRSIVFEAVNPVTVLNCVWIHCLTPIADAQFVSIASKISHNVPINFGLSQLMMNVGMLAP